MVTPPPSELKPRAIKAWLNGLLRRGGIAAYLPLAIPLISGALLLVQAGLLAHVLQEAIRDGAAVASLVPQVVLIGAVFGVRVLLGLVAEVSALRTSETIKAQLRGALTAGLLRRQPSWTAARSSGALSTTVIEQVDAIEGYLVRYLPAMVQAAVLPLAFAALMFPVDWMVGVLLLITIPLIPLFMALVGWGADAAAKRQSEALGRLSGRFVDRLRGLTTLSLFGRAAAETDAVGAASEALRARTMRVMRVAFLSSAVLEFFAALGVAGVALYIGLTFLGLVSLRGGVPLPLEAGLFCLLMTPEVYAPLRLLAAHYHDRANANAAVEEISRQFEALPDLEVRQAPATPAAARHAGPARLALRDVSLATPDGRPIVASISLEAGAGQSIAILGASGIGKSTLLEAIARLRDHGGEIMLDGMPLEGIAEPQLRSCLAMLGQRPRLFSGSIADNIRLGRRSACDTAVRLAAERACVTDFTDTLPEGLETRIGEDGLGLSGGELQRVALARIYLRDPGLLLMDEPTAHLDAATETRVLDGLMSFARGRTLVVATHSSAVAARTQRVLRLTAGGLLRTLPLPAHTIERGAA